MIIAFLVLLGLALGSGLNALAYRLYNQESWLKGRSKCPQCKQTLSGYELIPLVSFFIQKGKCRHCKKKISIQYPLGELVTSIAVVGSFLWYIQNGASPEMFFAWAIFLVVWCIWFIVFVHDAKHTIVLDSVALPGIVLVLILQIVFHSLYGPAGEFIPFLGRILAAALLGAGFFAAQFIISKGTWIGGGDVRLGGLLGVTLMWPHIITGLMVAYIVGSIISLVWLGLKKVKWKSEIPFGTFLALAAVSVFVFGDALVSWYMNLFHFL
ncbi:MAG: prepilin peptidase [Candidatus Jacksonbacteria bacterium]|jgi:prepilin signal peptidase PulO-like enzyme (type II secretory pathway)|nr:prepilin peptidase [Candidatus Jacksonbacteria bacterium]